MRQLKARAGDSQMHVAATQTEFDFGGGCAHTLATANHARQFVDAFRRQKGVEDLASQAGVLVLAHENSKSSVGLEHNSGGIEGDDTGRDGLEDDFEFA